MYLLHKKIDVRIVPKTIINSNNKVWIERVLTVESRINSLVESVFKINNAMPPITIPHPNTIRNDHLLHRSSN